MGHGREILRTLPADTTKSDPNANANPVHGEMHSNAKTAPHSTRSAALIEASTYQRAADAFQAFGEHFVVHSHADPKMIGHFEKPAWNC